MHLFTVSTLVGVLAIAMAFCLTFSWRTSFLERYMNGKLDVREEEIDTHVEAVAGSFLTPLDVTFDIPKGKVFESLLLRCATAYTIGAANCTGLQPHGQQRVLRAARLVLQRGKAVEIYDGDVQVWTPLGVNDGVAARTASFAGVALSREYFMNHGVAPVQTDPGLAIGVVNGEIVYEISFIEPLIRQFPWGTCLNTNKVTRAELQLRFGILETTAAGDDTDVYVTAAGSTVTCTAVFTLTGKTIVNCPDYPFDVKKITTATDFLAVNAAQRAAVGEDAYYRRDMLHVLDNDVDSDVRVGGVVFIQDNKDRIIDKTWLDLRQENAGIYGIVMPAGFAVVDFDRFGMGRVQNVWGEHDARLNLTVPAGAVVAADQIHQIIHEIRPHPGRGA